MWRCLDTDGIGNDSRDPPRSERPTVLKVRYKGYKSRPPHWPSPHKRESIHQPQRVADGPFRSGQRIYHGDARYSDPRLAGITSVSDYESPSPASGGDDIGYSEIGTVSPLSLALSDPSAIPTPVPIPKMIDHLYSPIRLSEPDVGFGVV